MNKKLTLEQIKKIELNVLDYFHNFCEENNLIYFLAYGTLLGAVRHKGFIPWDDDIDVYMPRKDYDWFIDNFKKNNKNENYQIISIKNNKKIYFPFVKIINTNTTLKEVQYKNPMDIGIWIDIYPLDNLSNNYEKAQKLCKKVRLYRFVLMRSLKEYFWHGLRVFILKILLYFVSDYTILKHMDNLSKKYINDKDSKYIGCVSECNIEIYERALFSKRILLDFEGKKFWAPKCYDEILTKFYGNYMELPPKNKRIEHFIDASYK